MMKNNRLKQANLIDDAQDTLREYDSCLVSSERNNNNININQILVNKNKNLITSKIKIKKLGYSNSTRNKKGKIIKRKPSNIIIQTSPTNNNINSKSSSNIFKKSTFTQNNTRVTNNLHQNIPYYFNINNKLSSSNLKKVPTKIHHLSKNNFNSNTNIEGKNQR